MLRQGVPQLGYQHVPCLNYSEAVSRVLNWLYQGIPLPKVLQNNRTQPKSERNQEIRQRYATGETLAILADAFGISIQRIHEIVKG